MVPTRLESIGNSYFLLSSSRRRSSMENNRVETMTNMSNLTRELVEEVLCRTPMTSMRNLRSTCKKWNTLSKDKTFTKKHLAKEESESMLVLVMNLRVYLIKLNLHNTLESCIKRQGKLISINGSDKVKVSQVFHCNGLLLCIMKDHGKLVVWNPYYGQTRCVRIEPTTYRTSSTDMYALGYDKSSYKVLVYFSECRDELRIYNLDSGSWRVLDISINWKIDSYQRGISLKGNTYWYARERGNGTFLVCFDFTRERFGPRLPLPVELISHPRDTLALSSVREEQLAVLSQRWYSLSMEIWITTKIEPNEVAWSSKVFLEVDMRPLTSFRHQFIKYGASFFVDEEKKVAVVFDKERDIDHPTISVAYVVGEDGFLKEVYLGESAVETICHYPLVCSYVPSLLQP